MSFNRHSIQRTAAAAFMALWIDSAFAWLGDFVLFFWLAFRKFSGKKGIAPCDDKSNAHFVHLISVGNRFEFASIIMCAIELISPYFNTASNSFEPPMQTNITLWEKWHMNLHFHMRWILDCKFLVCSIWESWAWRQKSTPFDFIDIFDCNSLHFICINSTVNLINHDWKFLHRTNVNQQSNDVWSSRHKCKRWTCTYNVMCYVNIEWRHTRAYPCIP